MLGIYWNNHHHLLHATTRINGTVLWANMHLPFWLSLVPFATRWIADAIDSDVKGKVSLVLYAIAIPLTFVSEFVTVSVVVLVALIWLVPDRRIEGSLSAATASGPRDDAAAGL